MRNQRPYVLKRIAEPNGAHSWDLRREGIGNPSQRINELEAEGHTVNAISEPRDGCPGTRYRLVKDIEKDARPADSTKSDVGRPHASVSVLLGAPAEQGSGELDAPSSVTSPEPTLFDTDEFAPRDSYRDLAA